MVEEYTLIWIEWIIIRKINLNILKVLRDPLYRY
jgi:hypothetical protein